MSLFSKTSNTVEVTVDGDYSPANFKIKAGEEAHVTFTRTTTNGCTEEIIFNGEKRALPLNTPVTFDFTPTEKGEITYSCGMDMIHGKYTVK
ncbi:MAG: cupredoxin domain-containing protein [Streptococcaceae bacterium]|jgi:Cu+-exporting ATPase|nr:cupredoxin domain-containing protein [Streptococcaceae bacterium]